MAHHKRKGPKSRRAGCLLCKPHKFEGAPLKERRTHSEKRWALTGISTEAEQSLSLAIK